jgi:hypothetical protein
MGRELELLAKKHSSWIHIVKGLGCNPEYAEDVVQDSYIKMDKYLSRGTNIDFNGNDVNTYYFFMILRSVYITSVKSKTVSNSSVQFINEVAYRDESHQSNMKDFDDDDSEFTGLINDIFKEVNSWDFYHKNMFIAYFTTDSSLRKISKKAKIGTASLYNSTKKYKEIIKSKFQDDYDNYVKSKQQ